ncbi:MFS transporter [Phenylobacterium sp.]|jgi:DHA2 family multidrug resistance protein-like MFS transporter|uniref:MFS transporter n=1 Tax=Phenylobacterium sp. TaxID=1871053 RepID=UPI002F94F6DF
MTLAVLDAGMTTVSLPRLAQSFGSSPADAIHLVTAYQSALVMALLPLGAMGERYGHQRIFSLSVALFAAASAFAALASDLAWLTAARFVQGLGAAGIMAVGMALLRFIVPEGQLGRAIGWNALNVALASAAAPTIAALVLTLGDWRGLFAINLPIAALALLGSRTLPATPRAKTPPDAVSMSLSALMFAMLIVAAQTAMAAPPLAAMLLLIAVLALMALLRREAPKTAPMFPLDLLRSQSFRLSATASVFCFAAQTAGLVALPFLLQHQLHQTPIATALYFTVWPLSVAVSALLAGRLSDRAPTAWLCAMGAGALAAGLAACAVASHPAEVLPGIAAAGLGFGLFQSPNNRNLFLSAPAERSGAAGGMQGTARVSGQTAGALIVALMLAQLGLDAALPAVFAAAALLGLAAAFASLFRIFT